MRKVWNLLVVGLGVAIVLLPPAATADGGVNCRSVGGCGEVREGLADHLSTNPLNWKCVRAEFRPMYPALPVCPLKSVEMKKPVPLPITFGAPAGAGVVQSKYADSGSLAPLR
jgi:hypothetical protein